MRTRAVAPTGALVPASLAGVTVVSVFPTGWDGGLVLLLPFWLRLGLSLLLVATSAFRAATVADRLDGAASGCETLRGSRVVRFGGLRRHRG